MGRSIPRGGFGEERRVLLTEREFACVASQGMGWDSSASEVSRRSV